MIVAIVWGYFGLNTLLGGSGSRADALTTDTQSTPHSKEKLHSLARPTFYIS